MRERDGEVVGTSGTLWTLGTRVPPKARGVVVRYLVEKRARENFGARSASQHVIGAVGRIVAVEGRGNPVFSSQYQAG